MQTIDVRTGRPYQVLIGKGLLEKAGDLVRPFGQRDTDGDCGR